MISRKIFIIIVTAALFASCEGRNASDGFAGWDYDYMKKVKKEIRDTASPLYPAYRKLISDAAVAAVKGPFSVTFKDIVPPGGTKNDYMSYGPYWWPDTTKPDGLPYIRRDGVRNPQSGVDHQQLSNLFGSVRTLSLAWFFTGDKKYASWAVYLLKVWFINPETKMNPHMEYAQGIPGINNGRGIGIIDARGMYTLVDAITLLRFSGELEPDDDAKIKQWFSDFFIWLTTSKNGHDEDNTRNNHAVAYDNIVTSIAIFLGNDEYAGKKISEMPVRRINTMIREDGRQPEELVRTKAFGYSVSNLRNFYDAGITGLKVNTDIFSYVNPEGGSLRKALDFLINYIGKKEKWEWDEIGGWEQTEDNLGLVIRTAAVVYNDQKYKQLWNDVFAVRLKTDWNLLVTPGP